MNSKDPKKKDKKCEKAPAMQCSRVADSPAVMTLSLNRDDNSQARYKKY